MRYISIHLREGKAFKHFHYTWNHKSTNLTIGGLLAGLYQSPLIFLFAFSGFTNSLKINNARDFQPTDFQGSISWRHLWERISRTSALSSAISFSDKGLKWFRQDQGLLIQALKRVGMPPVTPIATVNQHLPCNHLLSNTYSPWLPPWRN